MLVLRAQRQLHDGRVSSPRSMGYLPLFASMLRAVLGNIRAFHTWHLCATET